MGWNSVDNKDKKRQVMDLVYNDRTKTFARPYLFSAETRCSPETILDSIEKYLDEVTEENPTALNNLYCLALSMNHSPAAVAGFIRGYIAKGIADHAGLRVGADYSRPTPLLVDEYMKSYATLASSGMEEEGKRLLDMAKELKEAIGSEGKEE